MAAFAAFLPSFVLMLVALPLLDRLRTLAWTRAAMRAVGPAVIGVMAVSLVRLAPAAVPDLFTVALFGGALAALLGWRGWRIGPIKLMGGGALLGLVRGRVLA